MDNNINSFDAWTQNITVLDSEGNASNVSVAAVDAYVKYGIHICINYASQIGACCVLLIVLFLITRDEKRRSPIFVLNTISLLVDIIRNVLQCVYFTGQFYEFIPITLGDFSRVPQSQYQASVACIVSTFLLTVFVEASLVLQVRAVCVTLKKKYRIYLMLLSTAVALATIGFRFALMVFNSHAVYQLSDEKNLQWIGATVNYVTMGSILFFTTVFVTKLGFALKQRRKMGLRRFGPMQVIFIMGCQTLIIPAIFSILQNFTEVPELSSQTLTTVALSLPLSSLWATASLQTTPQGSQEQRAGAWLPNRRPSIPPSAQHILSKKNNMTTSSTASDLDDTADEKTFFKGLFRRVSDLKGHTRHQTSDNPGTSFEQGDAIFGSRGFATGGASTSREEGLSADGIRVAHSFAVEHERIG